MSNGMDYKDQKRRLNKILKDLNSLEKNLTALGQSYIENLVQIEEREKTENLDEFTKTAYNKLLIQKENTSNMYVLAQHLRIFAQEIIDNF